jgi:GWxTD domain-containing protein
MVADGRRARQGGAPLTRPRRGDHTRPVHPRHRLASVAVVPGIALALVACAGAAAADADRDAAALVQRAERYEARGSIETRRLAMDCLERATALAPGRPDYQLALGRVYYNMGFLKQARTRFQRAEKLDPQSADARIGIGQVWRRDWLKYLDRASLARAVENLSVASRLRPGDCQIWLELVPLLFEQKELVAAGAAAERALASGPDRADAALAVAYTSYRLGQVARADSTFRASLPRLPRLARERFDDIAPVASERDTATLRRLPVAARAEFVRRFWREHDPDLASPENEAQLEYWSRVAQAYFLYFDNKRREWDERGEVYVRYGPPERADYNPLGVPTVQMFGNGPAYPLNTLVWSYPSLGMQVQMQDRLLSEYYLLPISEYEEMDPSPDPQVLALRSDVLSSRGGRGVFPMLPPGARPRPVEGVLARFSGERGPRLLGQVQTQGGPGDSLWAEWVVLDSAMIEVARATHEPGVSACDPASIRAADFAAELPPGRYQVGITVHDAFGRRGLFRAPIDLAAAPAMLTLSDAVVTCGRPDVTPPAPGVTPSVHFEASPGGEVMGSGPLTVYFEMYDLRPDENGQSRFEYECTVRSAEKDPRIWIQRLLQPRPRIPEISATRREEQPGNLRRQFVTIPVAELADGRYRLDITVRDLNAGSQAVARVTFVKRSASPTGG